MTLSVSQFLAGSDLDTEPGYLFAAGTVSGDGPIYFPESYDSNTGQILVIDPTDDSSELVTFGGPGFGSWGLGHGHYYAPTDLIVYTPHAGYSLASKWLYIIDCTAGSAEVIELTGSGISTSATSSVLHSNGHLYTFRPANSMIGGGTLITKIAGASGFTSGTAVHAPTIGEALWFPAGATEGADGRIYAVQGQYHHEYPTPGSDEYSTPHILIYDPTDDSWEYSNLGMGWLPYDQMYAEGVLTPGGLIYYLPALSDPADPEYPALVIDSNTGTAWLESTILPGIGWQQGTDPYQKACRGNDGRIYYTGQVIDSHIDAVLVAYDPASDSYDSWSPTLGGPRGLPSYILGASNAGVIYGAPGYSRYGDPEVVNPRFRISDYLMKTLLPVAPRSYAFGALPVSLAFGSDQVGAELTPPVD